MSSKDKNLQFASREPGAPPPYEPEASTGVGGLGAPPPYEPTTSTDAESLPSNILRESWNLACNINVQDRFLQLDAKGKPVWTTADTAPPSDQRYQRDGFTITQSTSQITVTILENTWICQNGTIVASLLISRRNSVSLRSLGKNLIVFERTIVTDNRYKPRPISQVDEKGSLKMESEPSNANVWYLCGTDIYQAEGDEDDLVIESPNYLRLWDMAERNFRWEKREPGGRYIRGFTKKYVIREVGYHHLHKRTSGHIHGSFEYPKHSKYIDFKEENRFGPVMGTNGLFLYKPCKTALFIFRIGDDKVDFYIWESTSNIEGYLVLRGKLENLELKLLQQEPSWNIYYSPQDIVKNDILKRQFI
ncbi:hypothetical protein GGI35DRAFT_463893 [Trichoderma velutinum]